MEFENIYITAAKFGKKIEMTYNNHEDSKNYTVDAQEIPHPDLKEALLAFQSDMAESLFITKEPLFKKFTPNKFIVSEKKGIFTVEIKGKMKTQGEEMVNATSGPLQLVDDPNHKLTLKLNTLRKELFAYFFEDKTAQQKLPGME